MTASKVVQLPVPTQEPAIPQGVSQAEIARLLVNRNRLRQLKELVETHDGSCVERVRRYKMKSYRKGQGRKPKRKR